MNYVDYMCIYVVFKKLTTVIPDKFVLESLAIRVCG